MMRLLRLAATHPEPPESTPPALFMHAAASLFGVVTAMAFSTLVIVLTLP